MGNTDRLCFIESVTGAINPDCVHFYSNDKIYNNLMNSLDEHYTFIKIKIFIDKTKCNIDSETEKQKFLQMIIEMEWDNTVMFDIGTYLDLHPPYNRYFRK